MKRQSLNNKWAPVPQGLDELFHEFLEAGAEVKLAEDTLENEDLSGTPDRMLEEDNE